MRATDVLIGTNARNFDPDAMERVLEDQTLKLSKKVCIVDVCVII